MKTDNAINPEDIKKGMTITVLEWDTSDNSWKGDRLDVVDVQLPYVMVLDSKWSHSKEVSLDTRKVTLMQLSPIKKNTMKTTEIDGKKYTASTQDNGSIVLTPIEEAKPERVARCGDVCGDASLFGIRDSMGEFQTTASEGGWIACPSEMGKPYLFNIQDFANGDYVLKSDIVAALSIKDRTGDCMLFGLRYITEDCIDETRKALAALGITQDT